MRHIRPEAWADAARGRLSEAQLTRMDRHAGTCSRCASSRERVERAMETFADIRAREPGELKWEHIGARIYWVTSSERRIGRRESGWLEPRWFAPVTAVAAAAALVVVVVGAMSFGWFGADDSPSTRAAPQMAGDADDGIDNGLMAERMASTPPVVTAPEPLTGLVTFMAGEVMHNGAPLRFDALIAPGDRLQTRAGGQVAVQFGAEESFTLHSESRLTLVAFDDQRVQLDLDGDGDIVVDVSHRRPGQIFAVDAGDRQIQVRGTRFSVSLRPDGLRVACSEGEVAVLGDAGETAVPAGRFAQFLGGAPNLRDMAPNEVEDLGRWLFRVPTWTAAPELRDNTSQLRIGASAKQGVEIDGVLVPTGTFAMRVMPGRHLVRTDGGEGSWVEVDPGARVEAATPATPAVAVASSAAKRRSKARSKRRRQLNRALAGGTRLEGCVRALRKQGVLASAFIELELGVNARGTIGHLNIMDSNLSRETANCIRDAVDRIPFGKGPAANWKHRIEW